MFLNLHWTNVLTTKNCADKWGKLKYMYGWIGLKHCLTLFRLIEL